MITAFSRLLLLAGLAMWSVVLMRNVDIGSASAVTSPITAIETSTRTSSQYPAGTSSAQTQSISNTTSNWAGYEASGGTFSRINGSWTVPTVGSSDADSADASWIGIGGVSGSDLIQTGTQDVVNPDGSVSATAFYEMLPDSEQPISSVSVNPGDSISASIAQTSAGQWQIRLTDNTTGTAYNVVVSYNSSESSAEWVEEDPSDGVGQVPLDDFGTAQFTGATTVENGRTVSAAASGAVVLSMVNGQDQPLASVSALGSNGQSFSVTRTAASSQSDGFQIGQNFGGGGWIRHGSRIGRDSGGDDGGGGYAPTTPSGYSPYIVVPRHHSRFFGWW